MTERLIFTNTQLKLMDKKGFLKPDSEGYYEFPVGAFNCMNSAGEIYTTDNIDDLFSSSSMFMRKIQSGKLFGEWGHPAPQPGESEADFAARISMISDKDTCVFFREIWNDKKAGKHFTQYPGIDEKSVITFARLKPHGAKWETLQRAIDDPNVNVAFSVRNFGRDRVFQGRTYVSVEQIVTYDAVTHQGIASSEKYGSFHLEHRKTVITPKVVKALREKMNAGKVRMENVETVNTIIQTAENFFKAQNTGNKPGYFGW